MYKHLSIIVRIVNLRKEFEAPRIQVLLAETVLLLVLFFEIHLDPIVLFAMPFAEEDGRQVDVPLDHAR